MVCLHILLINHVIPAEMQGHFYIFRTHVLIPVLPVLGFPVYTAPHKVHICLFSVPYSSLIPFILLKQTGIKDFSSLPIEFPIHQRFEGALPLQFLTA